MKKLVLYMLFFVMLFSAPAFADEMGNEQEESNVYEGETIQPRYAYIGFMGAAIDIDSNGRITFSGSACADYRNVRLKLYLQRSKNDFFWDDIQGGIKTVYDNGVISYTRNVSADDYFYRAKLIVEVLDDDKNVIETQTIYSDSKRY